MQRSLYLKACGELLGSPGCRQQCPLGPHPGGNQKVADYSAIERLDRGAVYDLCAVHARLEVMH